MYGKSSARGDMYIGTCGYRKKTRQRHNVYSKEVGNRHINNIIIIIMETIIY
jgi:hypothetical protein